MFRKGLKCVQADLNKYEIVFWFARFDFESGDMCVRLLLPAAQAKECFVRLVLIKTGSRVCAHDGPSASIHGIACAHRRGNLPW